MGHVCRRGLAVIGALTANVMTAMTNQPALLVSVRKRSASHGTGWGVLRPDDGARTCAILPSAMVRIARGDLAT